MPSMLNTNFKLVTPGIRPINADKQDQKRTLTPKEAIDNGANYLVIGRPITQAKNPLDAFLQISSEL
jgi:orotidine-5'-phosphate decarboxylase